MPQKRFFQQNKNHFLKKVVFFCLLFLVPAFFVICPVLFVVGIHAAQAARTIRAVDHADAEDAAFAVLAGNAALAVSAVHAEFACHAVKAVLAAPAGAEGQACLFRFLLCKFGFGPFIAVVIKPIVLIFRHSSSSSQNAKSMVPILRSAFVTMMVALSPRR